MPSGGKTIGEIRGTAAERRRKRPTILVFTGYSSGLQRGVLESAIEYGWDLVSLELTEGALPAGTRPNGVILAESTQFARRAFLQNLRKIGCPVVFVGNRPQSWGDARPAVVADMEAQGRLAADHFAERGFRQVGYVGHAPWSDALSLYEGFRKRAVERGCACALLQFISPDTDVSHADLFAHRARELGAWLKGLPKPVGVLTYADVMAGRICVMAQQAGFMVPEEVAILGRGNAPFDCEASPVKLSSMDLNLDEVGRRAAFLLWRRLTDGVISRERILIPPRAIITRQSTDVLATRDPRVAKALRYMWEHLDLNLSVADIAKAAGLPQHGLQRAFRAALGRGVNAELRRKRLEELCVLLRTTDTPIIDLAARVGFASRENLHRCFRSAFGLSPLQYRLRERGGGGGS